MPSSGIMAHNNRWWPAQYGGVQPLLTIDIMAHSTQCSIILAEAAHASQEDTNIACFARPKGMVWLNPLGKGAVSAMTKQDLDRERLVVGAAPPAPTTRQRPQGLPRRPCSRRRRWAPSPKGIGHTFGKAPKEIRRLPKVRQGITSLGVRSPSGPPRGSQRVSGAPRPEDTPHAAKGRRTLVDQVHQPGGPKPRGSTVSRKLCIRVGKVFATPTSVGSF